MQKYEMHNGLDIFVSVDIWSELQQIFVALKSENEIEIPLRGI